jgi:hypothetical protein
VSGHLSALWQSYDWRYDYGDKRTYSNDGCTVI